MGVTSGLLMANPVPSEHSINRQTMESIIDQALLDADAAGVQGSANTPFVLDAIRRLSNGQSVLANEGLVENNVRRGARVAVELSKLEGGIASNFRPIP